MSAARLRFLEDIRGLREALDLSALTSGAGATADPAGIMMLRRGILVTSLIVFETFVRARTHELLIKLGAWPASFEELPRKFKDAAILHSLPNLHRFATMLRRQRDDYDSHLIAEIEIMSANRGPNFRFSKFMSGDYTDNLSEDGFKDLLACFQIKNCWQALRELAVEIGFGVPSVEALLTNIVRKRHRSAHVGGYSPSASDILGLPDDLVCLGVCFDAAISSSVEQALSDWKNWSDGVTLWRSSVLLYLVDPHGAKFRVRKSGIGRAIRIIDLAQEAQTTVPVAARGRIRLFVERSASSVPIGWTIS